MQLRDVTIERFGVWHDVTFPLNERGVTVLYGPNEAGKSTLMRFIRGVLFGFPAGDDRGRGPHFLAQDCAGSLNVVHHGQDYVLRRTSQTGTRGVLEISGHATDGADSRLKSMLGSATEEIFQNIFAIGLHELQQLASLDGEDVARHIYGLSLGQEGQQILGLQKMLLSERRKLLEDDRPQGELASLLERLREVERELSRLGSPVERHRQLSARLRQQESDISAARRRQQELQQECRGRQLMSRIWKPWMKERDLRRQWERLPADDLDREILNRFDSLELELSEVDDSRKALVASSRQLQQQAEAIQTRPELEQHICLIQSLFDKSRSMQSLQRTLPAAGGASTAERDVAELTSRLQGNWDARRLEEVDVSPQGLQQLVTHAEAYRRAGRARKRIVQQTRRANAVQRKLQVRTRLHEGEARATTADDVRQNLQRRLHEFEELRGLRVRRDSLTRTLELLARGPLQQMTPRDLPPFFWLILWFFVAAGVVLFSAGAYAAFHGYSGVVAGGPTAWIAGACFTLLGLSTIGIAWTMKKYFETLDFQMLESGDERKAVEHELHRTRQAIDRIASREGRGQTTGNAAADAAAEEEQVQALRRELASLEGREFDAGRADRLRRRLSLLRQRLQERQREFGRARREWTDCLRRMGLTETLKVAPAFEECRIIAETQMKLRERNQRRQQEEQQRRELESYLKQIRELASRLESPDKSGADPFELVAGWQRELQLLEQRRQERQRLRQQARDQRREAARLVEQINTLRQQRAQMLKQLGVSDRGEIAAKLAAIDERKTLEQQLAEVRQELSRLTSTEPDLAIVEDDLNQFDERTNSHALEKSKQELAGLEADLQHKFESLGILKRELQEIEQDRTLSLLRFDREQLIHALREGAEQWVSSRLADEVAARLRQRIEKERQPQLLGTASEMLQRLTCGRYHKIWTPLGEKILMVDEQNGQSLRVEHLSSGTREQVFLAVRMAMIRDFAQQGTELPMVLDDVTVNFDQVRTEAAVQTLLDLAEQGQQILVFTCHLHLAHLFEAQGLEPIWLPAQRVESRLHS